MKWNYLPELKYHCFVGGTYSELRELDVIAAFMFMFANQIYYECVTPEGAGVLFSRETGFCDKGWYSHYF